MPRWSLERRLYGIGGAGRRCGSFWAGVEEDFAADGAVELFIGGVELLIGGLFVEEDLLAEADELISIFVASAKTAKGNM